MSFIEPEDLSLGTAYLLTAYINGKIISSGEYLLVAIEEVHKSHYPRLGFARVRDIPPQVYLTQAHAQFGLPTWRHTFKTDRGWDLFWPIGAHTWTKAWVEITKVS